MKFKILYNKKSETYFVKKKFWFGWLYKAYGHNFLPHRSQGNEFKTITEAEKDINEYISERKHQQKVIKGKEVIAKDLSI